MIVQQWTCEWDIERNRMDDIAAVVAQLEKDGRAAR
jgi:hypothetical protein